MTEEIFTLWERHRQAALPEVPAESKGELWVLDEVIGGCVSYYLRAGGLLDPVRVSILEDCRDDLDRLLPGLEGTAAGYFHRLEVLTRLMLTTPGTKEE